MQLTLEVNTAKVVLNVVGIEPINFYQIHRHMLPMPALIPQLIIAISMRDLLGCQSAIRWTTVLRRQALRPRSLRESNKPRLWGCTIVRQTCNHINRIAQKFRQFRWLLCIGSKKGTPIEFVIDERSLQHLGYRFGLSSDCEMSTQLA